MAIDDWARGPLLTLRSARQGPRGKLEASVTVTGSDLPGDKMVPSFATNGPARSLPGPLESVRYPLRSSRILLNGFVRLDQLVPHGTNWDWRSGLLDSRPGSDLPKKTDK